MKKTYVQPVCDVVEMEGSSLICTSETKALNGSVGAGTIGTTDIFGNLSSSVASENSAE